MSSTYKELPDPKLHETYSTMSYAKVVTAVLVAATTHVAAAYPSGEMSIRHQAQPNTYQTTVVRQGVGALELYSAINAVYDQLLAAGSDLEPEMKDILYGNLWDLYE